MFKDLFETEAVLKMIFISKIYEDGLNDLWNKLCSMKDWTNLLRKERQILSEINKIPPTELSWLDLVNLYGYLIGEQVFTMHEFGLAEKLSRLPGNHPNLFVLATLKGFDKTMEKGGHLTSYYATYAIEGVCTFSYTALRNYDNPEKQRLELLQELNHRLANTQKNVVFRKKEAIEQIHILENTIRKNVSITLDDHSICIVLRGIKRTIANILPQINKWIYLTYAETSKEHAHAVKRMSTRFSFAVIVSPDFEVNEKGEINVESFSIFEPSKKMIKPKEEVIGFLRNSILPNIKREDNKRLIRKYFSHMT